MQGKMDIDQTKEFLKRGIVGRLGCSNGDKVHVVPITYAYHGEYIYAHTKDGLKIQYMRDNPNVCFEIDYVKDVNNWKSVIVYGTFEDLEGGEADKGLEILMNHVNILLEIDLNAFDMSGNVETYNEDLAFQHSFLSPFLHSDYDEISELVVFRIKVDQMSGKFGYDHKKDV